MAARAIKDQNKRKVQVFITWILTLLGVTFLGVLALFSEKGTKSYYETHNGLFLTIVMFSLLFIVASKRNKEILASVKSIFSSKSSIRSIEDKINIVWFGVYVVTLINMFIVDMSFISNYGMRVGAVVGVSFFSAIRAILSR